MVWLEPAPTAGSGDCSGWNHPATTTPLRDRDAVAAPDKVRQHKTVMERSTPTDQVAFEWPVPKHTDQSADEQHLHKTHSDMRSHFKGNLRDQRIGIWGLAFKPRTNDMRDAPAIKIIENLVSDGAAIVAYDPEAMDEAKKIFGARIQLASNNYGCVEGADALLIITEWQAFRNPNFERMQAMMRQPVIFDGRNIYDPMQLRQLGFTYYSVGRL